MRPQNDDQIERRLKELESEIYLQHIPKSAAPAPNRFQLGLTQIKRVAKITAFAATGFIGVWAFSTAVSFISIILGLMIAAGVGYVGYKLFLQRDRYR